MSGPERRPHLDSRDELLQRIGELDEELCAESAARQSAERELHAASDALDEIRARYADLYDFAPIACCTLDPAGVVIDVNHAGARLFGRARDGIVGRPLPEIARFEDPGALTTHLARVFAAAAPVDCELGVVTRNGPATLQATSIAIPAREPAQGPACRTALADIGRLKRAERELEVATAAERRLRERLEALDRATGALSMALATSPGADPADLLQVVVDEARQLADAEYAAIRVAGERGEAIDSWVPASLGPDEAAAIGRAAGTMGTVRGRDVRQQPSFVGGLADEHPATRGFLGVPVRHRGEHRGTLFLAGKRDAGEFSEDDQVAVERLAERVAAALEIARLRRFELREHARRAFMARASEALASPVEEEDALEVAVKLVVPELADLCTIALLEEGWLRRLAARHRDRSRQRLLDRIPERIALADAPDAVRAAMESGHAQLCSPALFLREEGTEAGALEAVRGLAARDAICAPLLLAGQPLGVLQLATTDDRGRTFGPEDLPLAEELSRHLAIAVDRARLYRMAKEAVRARDNMLAVVSHDLRSPLHTIRVCLKLLSDSAAFGGRGDPVELIQRSIDRQERLIDALRDAGMIDAGTFTVEPTEDDVAAVIEDALASLAPQADARSVKLEVIVAPDLPRLCCDRERIFQVLANLVDNALKFTDPGGRIRIVADRTPDAVRVSVADTGRGMSERQRARVFDRYWKGSARGQKGSGLGLFIAKAIIEAHHGSIDVESESGVGTTFSFTLPAMPTEEPREPTEG